MSGFFSCLGIRYGCYKLLHPNSSTPNSTLSYHTLCAGDYRGDWLANKAQHQDEALGYEIADLDYFMIPIGLLKIEAFLFPAFLGEEIKVCTDLDCPLWAYRPYGVSEKAQIGHFKLIESTNAV